MLVFLAAKVVVFSSTLAWTPPFVVLSLLALLVVVGLIVPDAEWAARTPVVPQLAHHHHGTGRELFGLFRHAAGSAESGGSPLWGPALHTPDAP